MLHMRKHLNPNEQYKIPRGLNKTHAVSMLYNCHKQFDTIPVKNKERKLKRKQRLDVALPEIPLQVFDEDMIYQSKPDPKGENLKQQQSEPIEVTHYRLVKDNVERVIAINTKDLATEVCASKLMNWQRDCRNKAAPTPANSRDMLPQINVHNGSAFKGEPLNLEEIRAMGQNNKHIDCSIKKKRCKSQNSEPAPTNRFRTVLQKIQENNDTEAPRVPQNNSNERFRLPGGYNDDKENIEPTTGSTQQFYFNKRFGKNRQQEQTENQQLQEDSEQEHADNFEMLARLAGGWDHSDSEFSKFTLSGKLENVTESNPECEVASLQTFSSVKMMPSIADKAATMNQSIRLTRKTSTSSTPSPQCKHLLSQRKATAHKNHKYKNFICKLATQLNVARGAIKQMQHKLSKHFGDCTTLQGLLEQYRFQRNVLSNLDKMDTAIKAIQEKSKRVSQEIIDFRKSLQQSNANLRATYFDNMKKYDSVRF